MINKLNYPIVTLQPLEQFNLVCITLIRFCVRSIESDTLQSEDHTFNWAQNRVNFRGSAFPKYTETLIGGPIDLMVISRTSKPPDCGLTKNDRLTADGAGWMGRRVFAWLSDSGGANPAEEAGCTSEETTGAVWVKDRISLAGLAGAGRVDRS